MQVLIDLQIVAIKTQISKADIYTIGKNLLRPIPRLLPGTNTDKKVAVVGYGPSLIDTWEQLKDFEDIITTSGAHDFLIERKLFPRYHVECDPRPHKAKFTERPHAAVDYLVASSANKQIFENLKEQQVRLWNFDVSEYLGLPAGEIQLPTYGDVGQQAIYIAKYLGYHDIHVFGMDYSYSGSSECVVQHSGAHGNEYKEGIGTVKGTNFLSHIELIKNLKFFDILMNDNQDIELTVYGNGLLSHYLETKYNIMDEGEKHNDVPTR